jgi:hypothetical protein
MNHGYLNLNTFQLLIAVGKSGPFHYWTEHNPTGFHRSYLSTGMLKTLTLC